MGLAVVDNLTMQSIRTKLQRLYLRFKYRNIFPIGDDRIYRVYKCMINEEIHYLALTTPYHSGINKNWISIESSLGQVLSHTKVGGKFRSTFPGGGKVNDIEILKVDQLRSILKYKIAQPVYRNGSSGD